MNEGELYGLLAQKFPKGEYAMIPGVRNGTGWAKSTTREADAIAISLWPSRGIEVIGFEIKVSRGDWLRELKKPAKAEEIAQFCDRWWIVVSGEDVAKLDEVPPNWGLLVADGPRLKALKPAPPMKSKPMDKFFCAALLRRAAEHVVPQVRIDDAVRREIEKRADEMRNGDRWRVSDLERDLKDLQDRVARFESESGVKIAEKWNHDNVGAAVKAVLDRPSLARRIVDEETEIDILTRRIENSRRALAEFKALAEKTQEARP